MRPSIAAICGLILGVVVVLALVFSGGISVAKNLSVTLNFSKEQVQKVVGAIQANDGKEVQLSEEEGFSVRCPGAEIGGCDFILDFRGK